MHAFPRTLAARLYLASDTVRNLASPPPRLGGFRTVGGDLRVRRADADPAPHGRGLAAACARRCDHDPGRASPGRHARDRPPFAAAARRLAEQRPPRVRRPLAAARHAQRELPRLPRAARTPPGRRRRARCARRSRRHASRSTSRSCSTASPCSCRRGRCRGCCGSARSTRSIRASPTPATMDRGPSVIHATELQAAAERQGTGDEDRRRRHGRRPVEPVPRPERLHRTRPASRAATRRRRRNKVIVARVFPGPVRDKNSNKAFDPTEPHGTHVAGIAAGDEGTSAPAGPDHPATANLSGVAPRAWIGNYRVFTVPTPLGHQANTPEIVRAFEAAVADGMNVINFSGGGPETDPANDAMNEAVRNTALAGVVPVIAAGNDREDFGLGSAGSPGTAPDAISVAATSNSHVFAPALDRRPAGRRHSAPCRSRAQAAPSSRPRGRAPTSRSSTSRACSAATASPSTRICAARPPIRTAASARSSRTRSPARSRSSRAASAPSPRRRRARRSAARRASS